MISSGCKIMIGVWAVDAQELFWYLFGGVIGGAAGLLVGIKLVLWRIKKHGLVIKPYSEV
jgi:hypothetical protein